MLRRIFKKKKKGTSYSWVEVKNGLFQGKVLYLPDTWGYKVINGDHESEIIDTMKSIVNEKAVFYDIGAHYGWFSMAWLSLGGFHIEAFEPSKDNCNIINETLKSNLHSDMVRLHSIALGEKSEKGILELYPDDSSRNFISKEKAGVKANIENIDVKSIDDIYDDLNLKNPDLIKIDVEGFEKEVLTGAKNLLIKEKPKLIIEIHDVLNGLFAADFLSNLDYKMEILGYKGKNQNLPLVLWY